MCRHGLATQLTEGLSMNRIDDTIDISMSTLEAMPSAVTIGGSVVNLDHVITKTTMMDVCLSGIYFIFKYELKHELI
jgi:hypothetical protein